MEFAFKTLAILIWMGLGATIGIGSMALLTVAGEDEPGYAPYAWMLGKPCWANVNGDYYKYRVVAVSHKGAVAIRDWDDDSAKAFWVNKQKVMKGWLRFGNDPYDDLEVKP